MNRGLLGRDTDRHSFLGLQPLRNPRNWLPSSCDCRHHKRVVLQGLQQRSANTQQHRQQSAPPAGRPQPMASQAKQEHPPQQRPGSGVPQHHRQTQSQTPPHPQPQQALLLRAADQPVAPESDSTGTTPPPPVQLAPQPTPRCVPFRTGKRQQEPQEHCAANLA